MATRLQIRNWVRAETLVEASMMSDADINSVIDQGTYEVATRFDWPFLTATDSTLTFVANQQAYNLPSTFAKAMAIIVDGTGTRLTEVSPEAYWQTYGDTPASGSPTYYFMWGNQIWVTPVPTTTSGGLVLYYYKKPTLMTDDTHTPEWDSQYHMILADHACRHLWHREEDFSKAKVYDERFLDGVERMARFYLGRTADSPFVLGGGRSRQQPASDAWRMPWFP